MIEQDRGVLYGDGLFETVRVMRGKARFLSRHRRRFERSAAVLGYPAGRIKAGITALDSLADVDRDGLWRITVIRGSEEAPGSGFGGVYRTWRAAPAGEAPPRLTLLRGFYFPGDWLSEHKTTSWLRSLEALRRAQELGFDEAVRVSPDGWVGEAAAANLFVCLEQGWVTPRIDGILPGVWRGVLLDAANDAGLKIEERALSDEELLRSKSMVLTSSRRMVTAAASINDQILDLEPARELKELVHGLLM